MTSDLEVRVIPPLRQWYERSALNPATMQAGGTVVKLRDSAHEARVAKLQRQLQSANRREAQWAPVAVWGASLVAIGGLIGTALWLTGGLGK